MALLLFYLFMALSVSFLCSIMESVLLSTPQPFLIVKDEEARPWARLFIRLKSNIDRPLAAILSMNTVAHTIGAAGVGAQVVKIFGDVYFGLASALLTILILVFTEIIPKTIGAVYWRNLARVSAHTIRVMIIIAYPLVVLSVIITRMITRRDNIQGTTREEITALAGMGAEEGLFNEKEHKIIQNLLRLKDVKVTEIMTPRVVVAMADENIFLEDFMQNKDYLKFSRIPVYHENYENITGYVFRQTVFEKLAEGRKMMQLKELKRDIVIIPESNTLFAVWETLLERKEHIALVIDEYGGMDGIITMEDIIETLLGLEIMDEKDTVTDMQKFARERWKARQAKYNYLNKT